MITFRIVPAVEAYCFKAAYILGPYAGGYARGNGAVDLWRIRFIRLARSCIWQT